jgi:NADH-quinone oxidoreductase subunit A
MLWTATLASDSFNHFAPVGVLLLMALAFGIGNLIATRLIGPNRQGQVKGLTYESGMNPVGDTHRRFNVRFYVVAMSFLVFDVEIVFLYPWAITFPSLADGSLLQPLFLGRMLFFILTSIVAFAYAWRKGVFRYD